MEIEFQQAGEDDFEFLWNLHKATMKSYVDETWGWNEEFQREYFNNRFETMNTELIIVDKERIGSFEIRERENDLYLANIEISPKFQKKGIGSSILKRFIKTSSNKQKPLKLQVLKVNPAKRLYSRFGFKTVDKTDTHFIMERSVE